MYGGSDEPEDEDLGALGGEEAEAPEEPEFEDDVSEEEDWEDGDEEEEDEEYTASGEGEGPDSWDAALANFDAAQDAAGPAAPAGPSKEEQELAQALAMVRFEKDDGDEATLVVSELPPEVDTTPRTFEEQAALLAPEDREALTANREAYASFPMDGLDLLLSETEDGRLSLGDAFLMDQRTRYFSRLAAPPEVPPGPAFYQLLPWEHEHTGDMLKDIDPKVMLVRMYFVGTSPAEPWEVDMQRVFSFDAHAREMRRHEVVTLGEEITDPVLRIREDGVFVEDSAALPGSAFVAEGFAGPPEEAYTNPDKPFDIREFVRMGLWPEPGVPDGDEEGGAAARRAGASAAAAGAGGEADDRAIEERLEELELMEELDDMPDVPAVDMV